MIVKVRLSINIKKSLALSLLGLILISFFSIGIDVFAGIAYDQTNGTWTNTFTDEAGISSKSNVGVNSNALKLTNGGGGYVAPYNTSGYAITTTAIPTSVAEWGTLTVNKTTPANTSVTIQVLDEGSCVFSNTLLSGNEGGFTTSVINISSIPPDRNTNCVAVSDNKIGRLRFKISLATTDTNVTPEINSLVLSWTTKRGDLTASPLANTAWPTSDTNKFGTRHTNSSLSSIYPTLRWVKDQGIDYAGKTTRGTGDIIYNKTLGGIISWPEVTESKLSAINRNTGTTIWERNISGHAFSGTNHSISANGTLYIFDIYSDILLAYDTTNQNLKWTYQLSGGHGNMNVNIGDDGTIYFVQDNASNAITVRAINPNGSSKWTRVITETAGSTIGESQISISPDDNTLYFGTSIFRGGTYTNEGDLYALNTVDGTIAWSYSTGDISPSGGYASPLVDSNGALYVANGTTTNYTKRVYAINPNGTLKWERSIGVSTDQWWRLSLRSDEVLLAERGEVYPGNTQTVEGMAISDGALLWSVPRASTGYYGSELFSDSTNGFFVKTKIPNINSDILYYDSDRSLKWKLIGNDSTFSFSNIMQDEDGHTYGNLSLSTTPATNKLFALTDLIVTPTITNSKINRGNTVNFSVTTSMQETNLLTGDDNKMQIVMDNDVVPLAYSSTDGNGDTIWTGSYTLPQDYSSGSHNYTVQVSQAGLETDIPTTFESSAIDSSNTGVLVASNFIVGEDSSTIIVDGSNASTPDTLPRTGNNNLVTFFLTFLIITIYFMIEKIKNKKEILNTYPKIIRDIPEDYTELIKETIRYIDTIYKSPKF